jgi:transmembrane sensor
MTVHGTTVTLLGQAYFVVPARARTGEPLIVRTENVTTRVLGTAFDVTRYAGDAATRVTVTEGRVSTGAARGSVVPAGSVAYVTDSTVTVTAVADVARLVGWIDGRLVFDNAPVRDVLAAVSRWYGVTVRLTDSTLAQRHLSTILDANRSQSETLAELEVILNVTAKPLGDTLVLAPRPMTRSPSAFPAHPRRIPRESSSPVMEVGR